GAAHPPAPQAPPLRRRLRGLTRAPRRRGCAALRAQVSVPLPFTWNLVTGFEAQSPSVGCTSKVPDMRSPLNSPLNGAPALKAPQVQVSSLSLRPYPPERGVVQWT